MWKDTMAQLILYKYCLTAVGNRAVKLGLKSVGISHKHAYELCNRIFTC
jgi:hypothetical protein